MDFSRRCKGIKQAGNKNQTLLCTFVLLANGKGEFFLYRQFLQFRAVIQ